MTQTNTIFDSAHKGDFELVRNKLDDDSSLLHKKDTCERLLLHWTAVGGNLKLAIHLIELGSPIDALDDTNATPLILASSAGHVEIVSLLISKGANVNQQTTEGHSALQYAASKGWLEICKLLVENKANVNITDKRSATPLHRAASKGNLEVVKFLLEQPNINVNIRDAYGSTPLHLACEEERKDICKLLVQNGADLQIKDREEKTPLDLCSKNLQNMLVNISQQ